MKPIEHVLLHPICVLSHLMCACRHCHMKLPLNSIIEHIEVAHRFGTSKNPDLTRFFIIKPRDTGRLKKQIWVEKLWGHGRGKTPLTKLEVNVWRFIAALLSTVEQFASKFRNLPLQAGLSDGAAKFGKYCQKSLFSKHFANVFWQYFCMSNFYRFLKYQLPILAYWQLVAYFIGRQKNPFWIIYWINSNTLNRKNSSTLIVVNLLLVHQIICLNFEHDYCLTICCYHCSFAVHTYFIHNRSYLHVYFKIDSQSLCSKSC